MNSNCEICTDHPAEYIGTDGTWLCRYCAGHCCADCQESGGI